MNSTKLLTTSATSIHLCEPVALEFLGLLCSRAQKIPT